MLKWFHHPWRPLGPIAVVACVLFASTIAAQEAASPGKVVVDGVTEVGGEKVFALKFLQGRDPAWANRLFFAKYDPKATWLSDLQPALGGERFFFEEAMEAARAESALRR